MCAAAHSIPSDSYLSHCAERDQPTFIINCAGARVSSIVWVKQVYPGTGIKCPLSVDNQTTCVVLTERLRIECKRYKHCTSSARIPQQCDGNISMVEYECIPSKLNTFHNVSVRLK